MLRKYNRLGWIDTAKGIGIILVVYAHVNYSPMILDTIYSFHMPLFFMISGLLYDKHKYKSLTEFIQKRAKTLICPYVFFYLAILLYTHFVKSALTGFELFDYKSFVYEFFQMFLSQGSSKVVSAPLWFVLCLFFVEILYYFISKLNSEKFIIAISAFCVIIGWLFETLIVSKFKILLPWSIDSAFFAVGFYALGNIFSDQIKKIIIWLKYQKCPVLICGTIALIGFIITAILGILNGHVSMGSKVLNNGFIFYLTGSIGSLSVFVLSAVLHKNKFLLYCGRNSFYIMATHHVIRTTYSQATELTGFLTYDKTDFIQTILPFIIVLFLSLLATMTYNKFKLIVLNLRHHKKIITTKNDGI